MDAIEYIEKHIRPLVKQEVVQLADHFAGGRIAGRGHFSIPREVFCYIDHLGELAFGGYSTKRAVSFIQGFFPANYQDYAELLVAMWRHATVHEHMPASYRCHMPGSTKMVNIRWLSATHNRRRERGVHLLTYPIDGQPDSVYLVMNTSQFAHDLLSAIDGLLHRLRTDATFNSDANARLAALQAVRDVTSIKGNAHQSAVAREIVTAWNSKGGLITESGNIIKPHPNEK